MTEADVPVLSVVVALASDTTSPTDTRHLSPCLAALQAQIGAPPMEIVVPLPAGVSGIESLRRRFPDVRFSEYSDLRKYSRKGRSREHHGELISRGFAEARGALIALIEDHDVPAPDWSANAVNAHRSPYAGIGGAIENGVDTAMNWAVYFSDFQLYQSPLRAGPSARASDANVIYKKSALEKIRPVWEKVFHEASVNGALAACGEKLALEPRVVVYQARQSLRPGAALEERFLWGRSFGAWRCTQAGSAQRLVWIAFSPVLPVLLTLRRTRVAIEKKRNLGAFMRTLPLTLLLAAAWSWGELTGYITRQPVSPEIAEAQALNGQWSVSGS